MPTLRWDGLSAAGSRDQNEDAWLACEHPQRDAALFAVADGLGGQAHGAAASGKVIAALRREFLNRPATGDLRVDVLALLGAAHAALQRLREATHGADSRAVDGDPDSTLVLLLFDGQQAVHAHLGDSRLYRRRGDRLLALTADHSVAALMASTLPPRHDPDRARLVRTASHAPRDADVAGPFQARAGDDFLLCSDGLWQAVEGDASLLAGSGSAEPPGAWLAALDASVRTLADPGQDNYTAVAVTVAAATSTRFAPPV